jgi:hypothetical protein
MSQFQAVSGSQRLEFRCKPLIAVHLTFLGGISLCLKLGNLIFVYLAAST